MDSQQPMSIPEAEQHQIGEEGQQEGFLEEGWESRAGSKDAPHAQMPAAEARLGALAGRAQVRPTRLQWL